MQSVLSRIWTFVAVSISYDDNHYIMDTFTPLEKLTLGHILPEAEGLDEYI